MPFNKKLIVVALVLLSIRAFSNSSAPAEVKEPEDVSGHQTQEWSLLQKELGEKKGKIEVQKKIVEELLAKSRSDSVPMSSEQIKELKETHKKLSEMTDAYNQQLTKYELRFPEKGLTQGRKYFRIDNLTLEQLENRMTLEAREKKLINKIRTQYNKPEEDKLKNQPTGNKIEKKPEVTEQIILVK
jgi:hypothetical protein